jgi:Uma2 family endonuclease
MATTRGHHILASAIATHPTRPEAVTSARNGILARRIRDGDRPRLIDVEQTDHSRFTALAVAADGGSFAVAVPGNALEVRAWDDLRCVRTIVLPAGEAGPSEVEVGAIARSPNGRWLAVADTLAVSNCDEELRRVFGVGYYVRVQMPFLGEGASEPEPDVAVIRGHRRDFGGSHPASAVLLVEVSDSTLQFDRLRKGPAYARAGVPEYWIVNLVDRVVEVYRNPTQAGYQDVVVLRPGDMVAPLAAPSAGIAVAALLP